MLWAYVLEDLDGEEIVGAFYGKKIAEDKSNGLQSWKSNKKKLMTHTLIGKVI